MSALPVGHIKTGRESFIRRRSKSRSIRCSTWRNTSFYGHIRPEWGKLWSRMAREVNPDFVFTAKLNRAFTHSPIAVLESTSAETIRATAEDERLAKEGLDSIASENMLGALLVQFPISFKNANANRDYLETVLDKFKQ